MSKGLSNPSVQWNGNPIYIEANSLSHNLGKGERNVRSFSAGGNSVTTVVTEDASTKIGMIKFSLANDPQGAKWANQMHELICENEFQIAQDGYQASFKEMTLLTSPEIPFSSDGVIELEFMGPVGTQSAVTSST